MIIYTFVMVLKCKYILFQGDMERDREDSTSPYKRKCRSWGFECLVEQDSNSRSSLYSYREDRDQEGDRTLELFPLHPEGR